MLEEAGDRGEASSCPKTAPYFAIPVYAELVATRIR